ncbi:MAG: hypothetical protein M3Y75_09330 [Actinomycetota bacterium]|nr:hypothetical protein [Actinomycetota bacterium]
MNGLTKGQIAFAILLIVVAALAALAHVFFTGFGCVWDTSTCAESSEKNGVYEGFLRTGSGEPYSSSVFTVGFGSREGDEEVPFRTDEDGHYCIRWAEEDYATVRGPNSESISTPEGGNSLTSWRDLNGRDPPPDCQESFVGIPWYAAEDAETTWQYWLLVVLPLAAIAVLLAALIGRRSSYGPS